MLYGHPFVKCRFPCILVPNLAKTASKRFRFDARSMHPRAGTWPKTISVSGKPYALDVAQHRIAVITRAEGSAARCM